MKKLPGIVIRKPHTGRGWEIAHEESGVVIGIPFKGKARAVAALDTLRGYDWARSINEIRADAGALHAGSLVMFEELVARYPGESCYAERLAKLRS